MKIVYVGNHYNKGSDDTEGHITRALTKLGHKVIRVVEKKAGRAPEGDVLLFHKWTNLDAVANFKGIKSFWYFDKVDFRGRENYVRRACDVVDVGFLTDASWVAGQDRDNLVILRQGIGVVEAEHPRKYRHNLAFTGNVYEHRKEWVEYLKRKYGLKVYDNVFNTDLYRLCGQIKIFVAPEYPGDDYYWSNRLYLILGSGGFLLHPDFEGVREEYSPEELVTYSDDLDEKIEYYLTHEEEREKIRSAGYKKTVEQYNFEERCKTLVDTWQKMLTI